MNYISYLETELNQARQAQADAEFTRELAGEIIANTAKAVQTLPMDKVQTLNIYVNKALELVGWIDEECD